MSKSNNTINNNNLYIYGRKSDGLRGGSPSGREEAGVHPPKGLSNDHIRTKSAEKVEKTGKITLYSDGSLIEVTKNRVNPYAGSKRDWVRGKVKKFSKRSRSRLMMTLAKISKKKLPLFITLTYPSEFPTDSKVYKSDLKKFLKRMSYRFRDFACIWKLEFQVRGAPHYHLLVWGLPGVDVKNLVSRLWYETVNSGDIKHLYAGTQVQKIRSWRGVMSYASKYMGKLETGVSEQSGRFWGVSGRGLIPWSAIEEYKIFPGQVVQAMRLMRRYAGIKSRDYSSLSIFVNDVGQWKKALLC